MNLQELSEVNFGLCLEGRVPATIFRPEWFAVPYNRGIEVLQQKGATKEDVAQVLSSAYINDAHNAVKKWNGIGDTENFDWPKAIATASRKGELSRRLSKLVKKLADNEEVDILPL
jgi:hypothetical protein